MTAPGALSLFGDSYEPADPPAGTMCPGCGASEPRGRLCRPCRARGVEAPRLELGTTTRRTGARDIARDLTPSALVDWPHPYPTH